MHDLREIKYEIGFLQGRVECRRDIGDVWIKGCNSEDEILLKKGDCDTPTFRIMFF